MTTLTAPFQLGDLVSHRGAVVAPLFPRLAPRASYVTLDEALARGFRIREVSESGSVPELIAQNPTDADVLLYDGEELIGAKQNRILNVTVLVGAESMLTIPVSCVEQGRWSYRSDAFAAAPHAAYPELRRRKAERLQAAPLEPGAAQHVVWDLVDEKAERHGVHSPTRAQADIFAARGRELEELRSAFLLQPGQCGAVLALGEAMCLDLVSRPDAFAHLYPKLLEGYLLDALERLDGKPAAGKAVEGFLERVGSGQATGGPSAGLGEDLRLRGESVVGSGLELGDELLQLSAFTSEGGRTLRPARIARQTARR